MVSIQTEPGPSPRRPGLWPALGVVGLSLLALGALATLGGVAGEGDPIGAEIGAREERSPPPVPPPASAALPPATPSAPGDELLSDGMLSALDLRGGHAEPVWRLWRPGSAWPTSHTLPRWGDRWELDPSGQALAFLVPSGPDGRSLWVRFADGGGLRVADDVLTFAWKTGDPDRIAWSTPGDQGIRLMTARLPAAGGEVTAQTMDDVEPGVVVGWTSLGVWVERFDDSRDERTFQAYAPSGRASAIHVADLIAFHPDGNRYLLGRRGEGGWAISAAGRGRASTSLRWDLTGVEPTTAAWSNGAPDRIALAGFDPAASRWWVQVWDIATREVVRRIDLPYRVRAVGWSTSDRLLLAQVDDDQGSSAVLAYDEALGEYPVGFESVAAAGIVPVPGAVVAMPEVTGWPADRASAALEAAGLVVAFEDSFRGPGITVVQDPEPGTPIEAGSTVSIGVGEPVVSADLDAISGLPTEGNRECDPASPVSAPRPVRETGVSLTEIRGSGDFELWGQLMTPVPLRARLVKMVIRFDAEEQPIFLARHPARRVVYSRWGPFLHDAAGSGYERPGHEWSIAFAFREPGCWTIRVVSGLKFSEFYVRVW